MECLKEMDDGQKIFLNTSKIEERKEKRKLLQLVNQ
jgi:hypothetical protein